LGRAPTRLLTSFPSLNRSMVGILRIEYCEAVRGFSSTLSFAILTCVLKTVVSRWK